MKAFEDYLEEAENYCLTCTTAQLANIVMDETKRIKRFEHESEIVAASRAMLRAAKNELDKRAINDH